MPISTPGQKVSQIHSPLSLAAATLAQEIGGPFQGLSSPIVY